MCCARMQRPDMRYLILSIKPHTHTSESYLDFKEACTTAANGHEVVVQLFDIQTGCMH